MGPCNHKHNVAGEIYIVQTAHCAQSYSNVYKLGRTKKMTIRVGQYPKGTQVFCRLPVSRMVDAENMLMSLCKLNFLQRKEFGNEYFEGNIWDMTSILLKVSLRFAVVTHEVAASNDQRGDEIDCDNDDVSEISDLTDPETMEFVMGGDLVLEPVTVLRSRDDLPKPVSFLGIKDPMMLIIDYINCHIGDLVGYVDTKPLLDAINMHLRGHGCKSWLLNRLVKTLKHHFKCSEYTQHPFDDGQSRHALVFTKAFAAASLATANALGKVKEVAQKDGGGGKTSINSNDDASRLESFLKMEEGDRMCSITRVQGHFTWLLDLQICYERRMNIKSKRGLVWAPDAYVFEVFGYKLSTEKLVCCGACKQRGSERGSTDRCCEAYTAESRRLKKVVSGMKLVDLNVMCE